MSLMIKGVKMPKNGEITIAFSSDKIRGNTTALILYSAGNQIENKNVVEIPAPNGRLIDADKLMIAVLKAINSEKGDSVIGLIEKAPTIIEAEVEVIEK